MNYRLKNILNILIFSLLLSFFFSCSQASSRGAWAKREAEESLKSLSEDNISWNSLTTYTDDGEITLENSKYKIIFDRKGASVKSIIMKEWTDKGEKLDLVLKNSQDDRAFLTYPAMNLVKPLRDVFLLTNITDDSVVFENKYSIDVLDENKDSVTPLTFTIQKTFNITTDYTISLRTDILFDVGFVPGELGGKYLYSVEYGPMLGPSMTSNSHSGHNERGYFLYKEGNKKILSLPFKQDLFKTTDSFEWTGISGKYFSLIAMPKNPDVFHISALDNTRTRTSIFLSRLNSDNSSVSDSINYYIGPLLKENLKAFDFKEHNQLSIEGMNLDKAVRRTGSFSHLQGLLKWIMSLFYRLIPNWGVSIIFLTLLVRVLLFPLYKKSMKSSIAMQKISPELENLKKQYKDQPDKLNVAMMTLYKKHNISPVSSLIPILIQFPVLLAMYGLLNNRFELREAVFIPGWINDLSSADTVAVLPFRIPILGNELHVLPFIYFASMMLSMFATKNMNQGQNQSKNMQRFMYIFMPIFFFFTLYNISSGLLVYWTLTNIISIIQQAAMNVYFKKEKDKKKEKSEDSKGKKGPLYNSKLPPKAKK